MSDSPAFLEAAAPVPTEDAAAEAPPTGAALPTPDSPPPPATYEALVASLDDASQALVAQHLTGLKTALQAERATVKKLEGQVKAAQTLAEEKARLETDLATQVSDAAQARRRADFYEAAVDQGVRRKSVRLAYLAALDAGVIQPDGSIAWDTMKTSFADLFEGSGPRTIPPSRSTSAAAGAGTRTDAPAAPTLNQIIRTAAGRR